MGELTVERDFLEGALGKAGLVRPVETDATIN
jgi:hypothetical protein